MKTEIYHLTNPQKSIWLMEQFFKNSSVNNIGGTIYTKESIDFTILNKAVNYFVKNTDSFRLHLMQNEGGEIRQYISSFESLHLETLHFSSLIELKEYQKELVEKPFSLLNSNLFKFAMYFTDDGYSGLILIIHHLIADAYSEGIIATSIMRIYSSLSQSNVLSDSSYSYLDYMKTEKEYIYNAKYKKDKEFWEKQFDVTPEIVSLSTSNRSSQPNECHSQREEFEIPRLTMEKIQEYCRKFNVSIYNFFMALYSVYIGKVSNVNDFVIGTPILNRTNFRDKHTCGMFISTVPFRICLENIPFSDFVNKLSTETLGIFRHQRYPYEKILEHVRKENPSLPNLYNILISYQNARIDKSESNVDYYVDWTHSNTTSDELDIHLFDLNDTGNLYVAYDYQTSKYKKEEILSLHERINYILEQILTKSDIKLNEIELITPSEKHFILHEYNHLNKVKIEKTIIELWEEQIQKTPNKVAISDGIYSYTYKQLNCMVNFLASYLISNNIQPKDKVCLFFNNSIELITCILATLKIGACYIPIDVSYPVERIEYIVHNSDCKKILTNTQNLNKLGILQVLTLTINQKWIARAAHRKEMEKKQFSFTPKLTDLAYIIYTSGSTGTPKGVKITHKSLTNYITWAVSQYVRGETTNFPLYSSISFDLTVTSIYTPLISGNAIYIFENSNPQLLLKDIIDSKKVQIIKLTPAHLILLQDLDVDNSVVCKLIVGGDILTNEMCEKITEKFHNKISIYNEYGPTEATVGCMIYQYTPSVKNLYASTPIGVPAQNTDLYVVNQDLNLIPFGYKGELCIGGSCLSKGYVKLEKVTNSCFIPFPLTQNKKIYRTGDLVKLYPSGIMEYIGRSDFQVKINGYRIEIGEIQSKILSYPNMKDCYIQVVEEGNSKILCAYYVSNVAITINNLKSYISKTLPSYMVPKYYIALKEIPLTNNGKVNKKLLPKPEIASPSVFIPPKTNTEKAIYQVFKSLLSKEEINVTSNFFDYYVDSLTIIKAQTKLYGMGYQINTQDFYEYPSIRELATFIDGQSQKRNTENIDMIPVISNFQKEIESTNSLFPKHILLFGVTGFLGIHLLHSLLKETNSKIYCIIREKNNLNAIQRFHHKFKFYFKEESLEDYQNRVFPITGNILKENFGLTSDTYQQLGHKVDCVISSAALVKHYGNYEDFNNTNVNGTKRIMNFCIQYHIPFHYISTLSVSGFGLVKSKKSIYTEKNFYVGQEYEDNVYVKSKFEAEKLILNAVSQNKLTATIYRMGNITNRFSDGLFQENAEENAFLNRLLSILDIGYMPTELLDFPVEFSPVDYCANFIVNLLKVHPHNIDIYHLFNNNYMTGRELIKMLESIGITIKICSIKDFEKKLMASSKNYFGVINYIRNVEDSDFNHITLSNSYTNQILSSLSLHWPKVSSTYLEKLLNYLRKNEMIGDNNEKSTN